MRAKNLVLLLILASLWGPSFLFIKIAVLEIPPITLAALRIGIAALILYMIIFFRKDPLNKELKFWIKVTFAGFFAHGLPFVLISWGEVYIDSALASILNGLTPLFTLLLANFTIPDDRLTRSKMLGAILGFAGLIILMAPHLNNGFEFQTLGIIAIVIAALSYAVGIVYSRKYLQGVKPLHAPASQLLVTAVYLIPISLWIEGPITVTDYSYQAIGSLLVLATFGTALAFVIYYHILEVTSASYLSLVTYLMPVFGVLLGVIFLDEYLSTYTLIGASFIIAGIVIANKMPSIFLLRKEDKILKVS